MDNIGESNRYIEAKKTLDSVSPSFCLAKWNQVLIHLGMGMTVSCHHPSPHKISEAEIKINPTALHNTRYKKQMRKQMFEGQRPKECDYCWRIEDNSDQFSDRIFKSSEPWARENLQRVLNTDWSEDYFPSYVEISFSNKCNCKCLYCSPRFSSPWQQEAERYGPIRLPGLDYNGPLQKEDVERQKHPESNPYLKAFWEWWPDLFKHLHTFRITGGEPLLEPITYQILDYIQEHWEENPNINLSINTNLNIPESLLDRALSVLEDLSVTNKVRELILYTSLESMGEQAEYCRSGLNVERFWKNMETSLSRLPKTTVTLMSAVNILSIDSFEEFMNRVLELKLKYHHCERVYGTAILLDASYIRWPEFMSIQLASEEQLNKLKHLGELAEENRWKECEAVAPSWMKLTAGFCDVEIEKIKRLYDFAKTEPSDRHLLEQQLSEFVQEVDRRRFTNFRKTFPEINIVERERT